MKHSTKYPQILELLWSRWLEESKPYAMADLAGLIYSEVHKQFPDNAENTLRTTMSHLRHALERCYQLYSDKEDGDICLEVFRHDVLHGYALRAAPFPAHYNVTLGIANRFWEAIYHKVKDGSPDRDSCRINIFFSNENPHTYHKIGNSDEGTVELINHSLCTGTGEAVGAFILGQLFAKLERQVNIYRSSSLGSETYLKNQVSIFLGSSVSIKHLFEMRQDPWLRRKQRFFFQSYKDDNGRPIVTIQDDLTKDSHGCKTTGKLSYTQHALISYFYNARDNQALIGLGGIDTLGTEQAIKDLSISGNTLSEVFRKLGDFHKEPYEFEALIAVEIARHASSGSRCIKISTPADLKKQRAARKSGTEPRS